MSSKVLIIISTGEEEKALTGLTYASKAIANSSLEEVRVVFCGPSERLLAESVGAPSPGRGRVAVGERR
ncbi:MAG TPA: hypothetical protein ENK19_03295 [Acidobacteria bacterium]|nr:hypothetical protein [Acidobacteriota bacterium]